MKKILLCGQINPSAGPVAEGGAAVAARASGLACSSQQDSRLGAAACPAQPCLHIGACLAVGCTSADCIYNTKGKLFARIIMRAY